MFFDLGYAHLNTAIVNLKEGELTVAGCYTDPNLGGRDFDSIVAEFMIEHIKKTANLDVKSNRKAYARVLKEAENIKKVLSANSEVHWGIECLMDDKDVKGVVNRSDLEAVAQPLLDRLVVAVEKLLSICKLTVKDIDSVEIIGGAVRIPVVASKLESFIGFPVSRTCDGDESVGRGCALQSALLSPKFKVLDFKVNDISPYPIEVLHGDIGQSPEGISIMFEQFNPTPSLKAMSFKRDAPLEVSFRYQSLDNIVESTDAMISTYKITGIPKADVPENKARIKLRMKLDVSGIVSVAGATMTEDYWVDEVVETPVKAAEPKPTESDAKMDTSETDASSSAAQEDTAMETEPSQDAAATPSESDKMDVDTAEKDKKPATEKTVVKKKKTRKVELPIEAICYGSLSKQKYQACVDLEMKMAQTDKTVIYTLAKKNDLESFCYEIRDKVQFEAVETASEDDKTRFLQLVDETEDWLYNEGYDTSAADYVDRLVTLKKQSEPLLKKPEPEPVPEPVQPAPSDPKVPEGSPEAKPESSSNAEDARQQ
jgi:molecular chaperone DnaK (HSP70)